MDEIGWDVFEPEMEEFFALAIVELFQELLLQEAERTVVHQGRTDWEYDCDARRCVRFFAMQVASVSRIDGFVTRLPFFEKGLGGCLVPFVIEVLVDDIIGTEIDRPGHGSNELRIVSCFALSAKVSRPVTMTQPQ